MKNLLKISGFIGLFFFVNACSKEEHVFYKDNNTEFSKIVQFTKNVLVMEFIAFDCQFCPNVTKQIEDASQNIYPDRIDLISVHARLLRQSPLEFDDYKKLQNSFNDITGYPTATTDQLYDDAFLGTFDVTENPFPERINASTSVGIALKSTIVNDSTVNLEVLVGNKGDAADDYRLAVAVLESEIIYQQLDIADNSLVWIEEYEHNHVLRAFLSENYFGDPIGTLEKDKVYSKTFTYSVPDNFEKDNLSFVAYVVQIKNNYRVSLNSRTVGVGKSSGFSGKVN